MSKLQALKVSSTFTVGMENFLGMKAGRVRALFTWTDSPVPDEVPDHAKLIYREEGGWQWAWAEKEGLR